MRTLTCTLVLILPSLLPAAEPAPPIFPNGTTLQLILLRQKSVQEELKLSPEVAQKVREFTDSEYAAFQKTHQLSEDEKEQKIQELEKRNVQFLADNLSRPQRMRLRQIALQVTGLYQLTRPEVVKLLDITEEQQNKFKALQEDTRKQFQEILAEKDRKTRNERLAKLRADIDKQVEAVLTDQQKEKARELVGEPFKGEIVIEEPESGDKDK
jgi:hypothetical protein